MTFMVIKNGDIIIHMSDERVTGAWIMNGQMRVVVGNKNLDQIMTLCKHLIESKSYICEVCGDIKPLSEVGGKHFAGYFCPKCWQEYKAKNARICRLCRQPLYRCSC